MTGLNFPLPFNDCHTKLPAYNFGHMCHSMGVLHLKLAALLVISTSMSSPDTLLILSLIPSQMTQLDQRYFRSTCRAALRHGWIADLLTNSGTCPLPKAIANFKSAPPVQVSRGTSVAVPGAFAAADFQSDIQSLAAALSQPNAGIAAEIWHHDWCFYSYSHQTQAQIGRAHV